MKQRSVKKSPNNKMTDTIKSPKYKSVKYKKGQMINDSSCGCPEMKNGGTIPNNYEGKTPEQVWKEWNVDQRAHFLYDHRDEFKEVDWKWEIFKMDESWSREGVARQYGYQSLPNKVKQMLKEHIIMGQYADGGKIKNQYEDKKPDQVWSEWTKDQRLHFLLDHQEAIERNSEITKEKFSIIDLNKSTFDELPNTVKGILNSHIRMGQYADGGKISQKELEKNTTIAKIEDEGKELRNYSVDESEDTMNAGDAYIYEYKGRKYQIITWNKNAKEHEIGEKTITDITDENSKEPKYYPKGSEIYEIYSKIESAQKRKKQIGKELGSQQSPYVSGRPLRWMYVSNNDTRIDVPEQYIKELDKLEEIIHENEKKLSDVSFQEDGYGMKKGGEVGKIKSALKDIQNIECVINFSIKGNANQFPCDLNLTQRMVEDYRVFLSDKELLEKYSDDLPYSFDEDDFGENGNMEEFRVTEEYYITFKDGSEIFIDFSLPDYYFLEAEMREEKKNSLAEKWLPEFKKQKWDIDIDSLRESLKDKMMCGGKMKWGGKMDIGGSVIDEDIEELARDTSYEDISTWIDEDVAQYIGIAPHEVNSEYRNQAIDKRVLYYLDIWEKEGIKAKGGIISKLTQRKKLLNLFKKGGSINMNDDEIISGHYYAPTKKTFNSSPFKVLWKRVVDDEAEIVYFDKKGRTKHDKVSLVWLNNELIKGRIIPFSKWKELDSDIRELAYSNKNKLEDILSHTDFNSDAEVFFDMLVKKQEKGEDKEFLLTRLYTISQKAASKENLVAFSETASFLKDKKLSVGLLKVASNIMNEKYKNEFKHTYGGFAKGGGKVSATSSFFDLFQQGYTYGEIPERNKLSVEDAEKFADSYSK